MKEVSHITATSALQIPLAAPSTRASNTFSQGATKTNELMDTTAAMKIAKYGAKCAAEGWSFKPFIVDVYGAARADARHLISQIIKKYQRAPMSAAAVMRAAPELHRLSQLDRPASLPLDTLNYATAREITSTLSLCGTDDTSSLAC